MDPVLYKAATQGLLKHFLTADLKTLLSVTPQQNTALHIASRLGYHEIAEVILRECKVMLIGQNVYGDTPLHLASKAGKMAVVDLLINCSIAWPLDIESEEDTPLRIVNNLGNTALHEAVSHRKSVVAMKLLEKDLDVGHMLNEKKESPLVIAAREGMSEVVEKIFKHPWVEVREEMEPADKGSPLHQAVFGGHIKIVEMLLYHRSDFLFHVDTRGNSALHYAIKNDNAKMVEMLLKKASSLAYLRNDTGQPPLLVAVYYGSTSSIKTILKHCPDTEEQLAPSGRNALHEAISSEKLSSLKCLLECIEHEEIINHQDYEGNTPLHLASRLSNTQASLLLIRDIRVDPCKLNNRGETARSVIETPEASAYDLYVWKELKKYEAKRCKKQQLPPVKPSKLFYKKSKEDEHFELNVQTYTLVAALIATVTFAATFTMPGGYNNQSGVAILANSAAFQTFVISNTIAMCSALSVLFCFIWASRDPVKFKFKMLKWGHALTVLACLSMIVSLMTAVFLVVGSESRWLGFVVILIGCCTPVMVWLMLGHEVLFVPVQLGFWQK